MRKMRYSIPNGAFVIDAGGTVSGSVEVPENVDFMAFQFPSAWTGPGADIFLDVSIDGGTTWAVVQAPRSATSNVRKLIVGMPPGGDIGIHIDVSDYIPALTHTNPPDGTRPLMQIRSSVAQVPERTVHIIYGG